MYSKSLLSVKVGYELTEPFASNIGVRQGDVLSPNLFKIFINDLPKYLESSIDHVCLNNVKVNCLLYADDVVLLSKSALGLQNNLKLLENFCNDWCIDVNTTKTKVLIFNKTGRLFNEKFTFRGNFIESIRKYKYLGIIFTLSGSFTEAKHDLYNKATKALFKLKSYVLSLGPSIKSSLHIYNHTIKTILNYSSEIWGCFLPKSYDSNSLCDFTKLSRVFPCQKLELHLLKYLLGVSSKASNFATISEFGIYPTIFDCFKSVLKYWYRLDNSPSDLLNDAFTEIKILHGRGIDTWYGSLLNMCKILKIPAGGGSTRFNKNNVKYATSEHLKNIYKSLWYKSREKQINEEGKLRTYLKIKCNFGTEKYLDILNDFHKRKCLAKFRVSNHQLKVELGRYTKPETLLHLRICEKCDLNKVEDEVHFFTECPKFQSNRLILFDKI